MKCCQILLNGDATVDVHDEDVSIHRAILKLYTGTDYGDEKLGDKRRGLPSRNLISFGLFVYCLWTILLFPFLIFHSYFSSSLNFFGGRRRPYQC